MNVEVSLYASLTRYGPNSSKGQPIRMEVPEECRIRHILDQLEIPVEAAKIIFVNGVHAVPDTLLQEGDRVGIFPPVAGG